MVLFENSWSLVNNRSFNNPLPATTAFQLFVAAFNDKNFAAVLMNHADHIYSYTKENQLRLDVDEVEGVDFGALDSMEEYSALSALLCQVDSEVFTDTLQLLTAKDKDFWLCSDYVLQKLVNVVFTLAHLENMVLINDGSSNKSLEQLNGESYLSLAKDLSDVLSTASICVNETFAPDATSLLRDLSGSALYMAENAVKGTMTLERSRLMTAFIDMMNRIAIDYTIGTASGLFNKTKTLNLDYADKQKFKLAYREENNNYKVGTVAMPEHLFRNLPFSKPTAGGMHGFIDLDTLNGGDKNMIGNYISYNLDQSCDCQHDCCGCLSESFNAIKLNDKWAFVSHSASSNY